MLCRCKRGPGLLPTVHSWIVAFKHSLDLSLITYVIVLLKLEDFSRLAQILRIRIKRKL
jgi:hypothetical protein